MTGPRDAPLGWRRTFANYSAGEVARISGLSPDMQRVWRRRGYLPQVGSGHARFRPAEVIEISIRYALSKLGVPPSESRTIHRDAISGALWSALINHHGSCEVIGPEGEVAAFLEDENWPDHALELVGCPANCNYLIWDDEGTTRILNDPQEVFDRRSVSIIAIDLEVVGARLMVNGRKPIVTLEAPLQAAARHIRRLSGVGR